MKKFLIQVFLITLPIILAFLLMEYLLRKTPNDYLYKNEYLACNSANIETLILGSSHAYYNFDPRFFSDNTFNASHISQSLHYDFEILKKYQNKLKKLKTIVLPISYFSLYGKLETGADSWRVKNYVIYYDVPSSDSWTNFLEIMSNRFSTNVHRIVSYYVFNKSTISCSDLGWGTQYKSQNRKDLLETGKKSALRHTLYGINPTEEQKIFKDNVEIVTSILQWGQHNNVHIYLLTPPAYESYRQALNQEQLQTTIDTTFAICSQFDNCSYENLMNEPIFEANDYYDADHLSDVGAKKLSILVNDKIIKWQ